MRITLALLLGAFVLQLAYYGLRKGSEVAYTSLEVGERLPFSVPQWTDELQSREKCHVGFLVDPNCGACTVLGDRFAGAVPDTLPGRALPRWFVMADARIAREWAEARGLPPSTVYTIGVRTTWGGLYHEYGSIYFTPTRVILTGDLIVRDARPSDELPEAARRDELCLNGGIAPRSLAEFVEIMSGTSTDGP